MDSFENAEALAATKQHQSPRINPLKLSTQIMNYQLDKSKLSDPNQCIQELNKRYAVVKAGSKVAVVDDQPGSIDLLPIREFEGLYCNIKINDGVKNIPVGKYWVNHPNRRQYLDGIVFDPSGTAPSTKYNLWKGFAIDENPSGSCQHFLDHLRTIICSNQEECYEYAMDWLAHMVQKPYELPGTAICMLSTQGTGKGLFMQYLRRIFGNHYKHLTNKNQLIGQFTGHLHDAVLVFADELSWSSNSSDTGILKGLITEEYRMMERKFSDAIMVRNCVHLIIASNDSWAIPAEIGDRRFFVLDVSAARKGDSTYFQLLANEMKSGGPGALLYCLQHRDISDFNPAVFPKTSARVNQQVQSLDPVDGWMYEMLMLGSIHNEQDWPEKIEKQTFYNHFSSWTTGNKHPKPTNIGTFTSALRRYQIKDCRLPAIDGKRPYGYQLPSVDTLRTQFESMVGREVEWEQAA